MAPSELKLEAHSAAQSIEEEAYASNRAITTEVSIIHLWSLNNISVYYSEFICIFLAHWSCIVADQRPLWVNDEGKGFVGCLCVPSELGKSSN